MSNTRPTTKPNAKAIKLNAESVIPIIIAVTKRPIPMNITPKPDILQKHFLSLGDTLS